MRIAPKSWANETWICSIRGHVAPAAEVQHLQEGDQDLGLDLSKVERLARCLRCGLWVPVSLPRSSNAPLTLPPRSELPRPRTGKALEDAIFLRLIACERGLHAVAFTVLALALAFLRSRLDLVHRWAQSLIGQLTGSGHPILSSWLLKLNHLNSAELTALFVLAVAYAVVEGIEAVGLWKERRWAEYLTVIATAGFLPLEIHEIALKVTFLRCSALVINLAIVVYLIWNKHLFGLRSSRSAPLQNAQTS